MHRFRTQDVVARLSGVSLQQTVTVLNALFVVSKALEQESPKGFCALRRTLELLLVESAVDDSGIIRGLRATPNSDDVQRCYQMTENVEREFPVDVRNIKRNSGGDVISSLAEAHLDSASAEIAR